MSKKHNLTGIWLARKAGAKENAAVHWVRDDHGMNLALQWNAPDGSSPYGRISPRLARLLVDRIKQALDD